MLVFVSPSSTDSATSMITPPSIRPKLLNTPLAARFLPSASVVVNVTKSDSAISVRRAAITSPGSTTLKYNGLFSRPSPIPSRPTTSLRLPSLPPAYGKSIYVRRAQGPLAGITGTSSRPIVRSATFKAIGRVDTGISPEPGVCAKKLPGAVVLTGSGPGAAGLPIPTVLRGVA